MISEDSSNSRILVVDDEPTLRLGFSFALATENYDVETAPDGLEGLKTVTGSHFDAMVLDLRMPQMDGLETLARLRSEGNRVPVILCSAHITPAAAVQALELECYDFLAKPVHPVDLRKGVSRLLVDEPESTMDRILHHLRHSNFEGALQVLEEAEGIGEEKKAFWSQLLHDLRTGQALDTDLYVEGYGRDLIPLLSLQEL